jgi:Protein of unknown function (DUF3105)
VAKKKSRVPPPPRTFQTPQASTKAPKRPAQAPKRPVQAPQAGRGPRAPVDRRRTWLWVIGSGVAVVAVVVAVLLATALGGGSDASALAAAGCVQETFTSQGRQHVTQLEPGFKYNSFPPTSGPHNPRPAIWNVYDDPVRPLFLVHNLEHGGIVVQYGDEVPEATVAEIRNWYANTDRTGIVVAPLPGLKGKVALTAWTKLATCPGFDQEALDAFVDLHRFNGPERVSGSNMQPGT